MTYCYWVEDRGSHRRKNVECGQPYGAKGEAPCPTASEEWDLTFGFQELNLTYSQKSTRVQKTIYQAKTPFSPF